MDEQPFKPPIQTWLAHLMRDADPAALVPESVIALVSQRLTEEGCLTNPPFLGAEIDQAAHNELVEKLASEL